MAISKRVVQLAVTAGLFLTPLIGMAAGAPQWTLVPNESSIIFTGTQNNSPVSGQFKSFTGEINGDPGQLESSKIHIVIDTNSISLSYKDIADTLKTPDWFDVKLFPQAEFTSNQITKTGDKTYQAKGTLKIRDKSAPVILTFTLEDYSKNRAKVTGSASLKRTEFGIGKGEWADLNEVRDEVKVNFTIMAVRK